MRHLFTYGPVPVDQIDRVPLKETEIGPVPQHWEVIELKDIFKLSSGKPRPKEIWTKPEGDHIVPIYGGNGILGYTTEVLTEDPTIVLGRVGEYCGSVYLTTCKAWISDNALYMTELISRDIFLEYLTYCLIILDLNKYKKKSGQPLITQGIVYKKKIPVPPLDSQEQIIYFLKLVEQKLDIEETRKSTLQSLFQTMLHLLMTGKVRVKDQEVNVDAIGR